MIGYAGMSIIYLFNLLSNRFQYLYVLIASCLRVNMLILIRSLKWVEADGFGNGGPRWVEVMIFFEKNNDI